MLSYCMQFFTAMATHTGLPAAAPIHSTSWLPHCMSTLWWPMRLSSMTSAWGPRSNMSPTMCRVSTAMRFMKVQSSVIRVSAMPVSITERIMLS